MDKQEKLDLDRFHYSILKYFNHIAEEKDDEKLKFVVYNLQACLHNFILEPNDVRYALGGGDRDKFLEKVKGYLEPFVPDDPEKDIFEEKFDQYKKLITEKGYFGELEEGSPEYDERLKKAKDTFYEKFRTKSQEQKKVAATEMKEKGNFFFREGNFESALECYNESITLDPGNPIFYGNRGVAHSKMGNIEDAIEDFNKALSMSPTLKNYKRLIRAFKDNKSIMEANNCLVNALQSFPDDEELLALKKELGAKMPGMPGMGDMFGNNPQFQGMMENMMNNPEAMEQAKNMFGNPEMMQMVQGMLEKPEMQEMMQNFMQQMMSGDNPFASMFGNLPQNPEGN